MKSNMKSIKLSPFILGMIFSVNSFAQVNLGVQPAAAADEIVAQLWQAPTPLTTQILVNRSAMSLTNNPLLNKINELLTYAELEGMQKDWFVNDQQVAALNNLAAQNDLTTLRAQAGIITKNILTALNRGYITPNKIGEKANAKTVKTKTVDPVLLQNELTKFAAGTVTAAQLFDTFRPKNSIYSRNLAMYRKITAMKANNQIIATPVTLSTIKPGASDQASILFARQRLAMFGYANDTTNATYTEDLKIAIEHLQENNLLKLDGIIGKNSFGLLNTPVDQIITRLKINLDRSRWLPDNLSAEYVHINLAAQRLFYYKNSVITLSFKTANGRVERPTPIMFDKITHMRLNPTWTVPRTIYFKDKGKLFAKDPQQAIEKNYHFFDLRTKPMQEVSVYDIDWATETSDERFKSNAGMNYQIVQYPDGDKNALGWIKFPLYGNESNIFMHDTNTRKTDFAGTNRMISSGCIRMEKPFELAEKLLSSQINPTTGLPVHTVASLQAETLGLFPRAVVETKRSLGREIPVYVLYETTQINDSGQMTLVADPYGIDMDMYNLMTSGNIKPALLGAN